LIILNATNGSEVSRVSAHTGTAFGLTFVPGESAIVSAGHDQLIRIWKVPDLDCLGTLRGHCDEIWGLGISPNGRLLCTAGKDGTAKVWNRAIRSPLPALTNVHTGEFSRDSRFYVTVSKPASALRIMVWDLANPGLLTTKALPLANHDSIRDVFLGAEAQLLAFTRQDGTAELWDLDTGALRSSRSADQGAISAIALSTGAEYMALGEQRGSIELCELETGNTRQLRPESKFQVARLQFAGGDRYVLATLAGDERTTRLLFDVLSGNEIRGKPTQASQFQISPDGTLAASSTPDYEVELWTLPTFERRAVLKAHRWTVYCLAFSPNSKLLATGGADAVTRLWNVQTGMEVIRPLRGHLQGITEMVFSPDGTTLATGSTDNTVKLWHVPTGRELLTFKDSSEPSFSPDGSALLLHTREGRRLLRVPSVREIDAQLSQ
jgi:WD40 repeat protein